MPELSLPKTRLFYADGTLTKQTSDGATLASFPGNEIKAVRSEETAEYGFPLVLGAVFAGLATVSKMFIESPGLSWSATIVCGGIVAFSLLMVKGRKIVIETKNGSIGYPVNDQFEEADGFVVSLRHALEQHQASDEETSSS